LEETNLSASDYPRQPLHILLEEAAGTLIAVATEGEESVTTTATTTSTTTQASSNPGCCSRGVTFCLEKNLHKRLIPFRVRKRVVGMFDLFRKTNQSKAIMRAVEEHKTMVLVEIVSAMGLSRDARDGVDPYVIVKQGNKEIHRTKPVQNDGNPIWTIKTKSLFVVPIPDKLSSPAASSGEGTKEGGARIQTDEPRTLSFQICDGFKRLATLTLTNEEVLENVKDHRIEYRPIPAEGSKLKHPVLALRFRLGSAQDLTFLGFKTPESEEDLPPSPKNKPVTSATDMNFKEVRIKNIFQQYRKRRDGIEYVRLMPGPDPDRPKEETEWMTKEQIVEESLKPSKKWVNAGHGTMGKIYVEILAADDLPNMDVDVNRNNDTDPFVSICFEDNLVRTDMLWDISNPRWMPWTMRAFCFHVRHPTSLLMLGVFDYDETPLDSHDPIGHVVINTANFYSDTEYLLRYNLHHDPRQVDEASRGSILIRMRLEWTSEVEAMKASYAAPPKFIINCPTAKSHNILRYLTRGAIDMENPSVDTVKLYASEVASYWTNYCYFLDVLFETLLWRGRCHISPNKSFWFPIQSAVCSGFILVSLECPRLSGAMFFYMLAWAMLSVNYWASRHPNPWKRVKRSEETNVVVLTGRSIHPPIHIEPNQGVEEGAIVDRVDKMRGQRMSKLITEFMYFVLKIYRIYSKTTVTAKFFSTPKNEWSFLSGRLYYLHMLLKYLCKYTRIYFSLINWQGYYTNKLTTTLVVLGTLCLFPPVHFIAWWTVRILAWTLLGPWMKLVDVCWVLGWYKTSDELTNLVRAGVEPTPDLPDFEAMLDSEVFLKMSQSGRIVGENAVKLRDMREHVFGHFSEAIPAVDSSRFPSVPLPASSARPWKEKEEAQVKREIIHVPGQKLRGTMILRQENSFTAEEDTTHETVAKQAGAKKND